MGAGRKERVTVIPSVYLVLRRDNEVLLLRRANTGYMDGRYSLVAGHLDENEPASLAMAREAKEEAGITVRPEDLRLVHTGHRHGRARIDLFFETGIWQGEVVNAEPELCDDLSWHPFHKLPTATVPYVRFVLEAIAAAIPYSEYPEYPDEEEDRKAS